VNLQAFDLVILLVLGALGFLMRRYGLPVLPLILGVIIGPRAELQLRRVFQLSGGDVSGLWSEPLAVVIYVVIALVLAWPLGRRLWRRLRPPAGGQGPDVRSGSAATGTEPLAHTAGERTQS
jgi:putative tricarboxylic transport membrane protein